jgi:cytochrome c oxidase subunit I+III
MTTTVQRRAGVISPDPSPGPDHLSDDPLERQWADPPGLVGWLSAVQNDAIGGRVMLTAFTFFLLAGLLALLMRIQLVRPQNNFMGPQTFNELFTMHGATMMFLFVIPMLEGLAIVVLPFILGSREMPFPRLGPIVSSPL